MQTELQWLCSDVVKYAAETILWYVNISLLSITSYSFCQQGLTFTHWECRYLCSMTFSNAELVMIWPRICSSWETETICKNHHCVGATMNIYISLPWSRWSDRVMDLFAQAVSKTVVYKSKQVTRDLFLHDATKHHHSPTYVYLSERS